MADTATTTTPAERVLETPGGLKYLAPASQAVLGGILRAHVALSRALDAELQAAHGVGLSTYEVLARLAHAPELHLRMSDLAEQTQLSLSRVSRLIDHLQSRQLASRRSCAEDSRIVYATLEPSGRRLVAAAQETFFAVVDRFLGRLSDEEVEQLGALLDRLVDRRASGDITCGADPA